MKLQWILSLGLLAAVSCAKQDAVQQVQSASKGVLTVRQAVDEYRRAELTKAVLQTALRDDDCRPERTSCLAEACNLLPRYECDDNSDLDEVASACRGNRDGACLREIAQTLPAYSKDDMNDIRALTAVCASGVDHRCFAAAKQHLPSYELDDLADIREIGEICKDTDGRCVEAACARLPSYECDSPSDLREVAATCRGDR